MKKLILTFNTKTDWTDDYLKTMESEERLRYLMTYYAYSPDVIVGENIKAKIIGFQNSTVKILVDGVLVADVAFYHIRLVLRVLSDLKKPIVVNNTEIVPFDFLMEKYTTYFYSKTSKIELSSLFSNGYFIRDFADITKDLYSFHFDLFNLIGKGWAIDYNSVIKEEEY